MPQIRASHTPCCGGRLSRCRDEFRAGSPLARPSTLKLTRRRGAEANLIGVYYHPGLETWVAYLGDPAGPIAEAQQPSPMAALRQLLVAIEGAGVRFDDEWSPA